MVKHFAINQGSMTILEMLEKADEEINTFAKERGLKVTSVTNQGRTFDGDFNGYIFVTIFSWS